MSSEQDQAKLIAERVARRVQGPDTPTRSERTRAAGSGGSARDELSAIRAGLHDLESKLERIESSLTPGSAPLPNLPRARVIDFVASGPPAAAVPSINAPVRTVAPIENLPTTQSPWTRQFQIDHPSQERFGVEEAAVSELVEFFENEKQCTVEPGGKPCDHCAMCSSRGF